MLLFVDVMTTRQRFVNLQPPTVVPFAQSYMMSLCIQIVIKTFTKLIQGVHQVIKLFPICKETVHK